jgi:sortase A
MPSKQWVSTATLIVPRLKLNMPIYVGITLDVFDHGIGQWPGTAAPGQAGNLVLGGHRTSWKRPFYNIDQLKSGDPIMVVSKGVTYTYTVTGHRIVKPTDTWIIKQTPTATLTLFACNPRGKITQRYVVSASLSS